jgi:hypothetical protein
MTTLFSLLTEFNSWYNINNHEVEHEEKKTTNI